MERNTTPITPGALPAWSPPSADQQALFSRIYERLPVAIIECMIETGEILTSNQRWRESVGASPLDGARRTLWEIIHPEDLPAYHEAVRQLTREMSAAPTLEMRCQRPNGSVVWGDVTLWSLGLPDNTPSAVIMVFNDITGLKQAREERAVIAQRLAQAQRLEALGTLVGGVAHDFNNILTPIIGFTDLVATSLPEGSQERESLELVHASAWRACTLARSLLAFSRHANEEMLPIPLAPAVKEVVKMIRAIIPASIDIISDIAPVGAILADPVHVQQILMNLCTNAYHAMRDQESGRLRISVDTVPLPAAPSLPLPRGSYARIVVSDTGCGIEHSALEHIFEPFFTTKQPGEGTGLGLSLVHGIIQRLDGAIEVESEPGQGTRFTVYLPITGAMTDGSVSQPPETLPGGTERILIVDDENNITTLLRQLLGQLGYSVVAVNCSGKALDQLSRERFDLLITDLAMPTMGGIELIKKAAGRNGIKSIISTGHSDRIKEADALIAGASAFMVKPYTKSELARTVRQVLDGKLPRTSPVPS